MGAHLIDGEFQSDKYPTTPRGKVPLSVKDVTAQDLLWEYARRRSAVDPEFAADLEAALIAKGYVPPAVCNPANEPGKTYDVTEERKRAALLACDGLPTEWLQRGFIKALYRVMALLALCDHMGDRAGGNITHPQSWWDAHVRGGLDALNNIADAKRVN